MGGAVSTGQDNDELIDNLLEANYIKTPQVERVFRAVDRGEYFLPDARMNSYKDLAWKSGNLHLSAPCIYSEVLEGLCLSSGLSFLNLGSGTGYLSTMVGLILGSNGVNHGIEIHEDVIQYAKRKLEVFKRHSGAIDEFDFCEPKFIQGNCLCLTSDVRRYDRVYCGAACPEMYESYMKNLLNVGGVLVMPLNDQLLQIKRISESKWDTHLLLPVSFATLIRPPQDRQEWVQLLNVEPHTLQEMSRSVIRGILRKNIEIEFPDLKKVTGNNVKRAPKKKKLRRHLLSALSQSDESSEDDCIKIRYRCSNNVTLDVHRTLHSYFASKNGGQSESDIGSDFVESEPESIDNRESTESNEVEAIVERQPLEGNDLNTEIQESPISTEPIQCSSTTSDCNKQPSQAPEMKADNNQSAEKKSRAKFDSGLGDEIVETNLDHSSEANTMELDTDSSSDDEIRLNMCRDVLDSALISMKRGVVTDSSSDNETAPEEAKVVQNEIRTIASPYTAHMKSKIQQLPLPNVLKNYLNFYREF